MSDLRKLAEGAKDGFDGQWYKQEDIAHMHFDVFIAAASPDVVLGLLDEIAALEEGRLHLMAEVDQLNAAVGAGQVRVEKADAYCRSLVTMVERESSNRDLIATARRALDRLARMGNEPYLGNSPANMIARDAIVAISAAADRETPVTAA